MRQPLTRLAIETIGKIIDEIALDALKEPMHIATHKLAPSMLKDQVCASALMEKPIHVTTNEPTPNVIEEKQV